MMGDILKGTNALFNTTIPPKEDVRYPKMINRTLVGLDEQTCLSTLKCTEEQRTNLARDTETQSKSQLWFDQRKGRITSSLMHVVTHCRKPESAVKQVMRYNTRDISHIPAVKWGVDNEVRAKQVLLEFLKKERCPKTVLIDIGLCISSHPLIAASPGASSIN